MPVCAAISRGRAHGGTWRPSAGRATGRSPAAAQDVRDEPAQHLIDRQAGELLELLLPSRVRPRLRSCWARRSHASFGMIPLFFSPCPCWVIRLGQVEPLAPLPGPADQLVAGAAPMPLHARDAAGGIRGPAHRRWRRRAAAARSTRRTGTARLQPAGCSPSPSSARAWPAPPRLARSWVIGQVVLLILVGSSVRDVVSGGIVSRSRRCGPGAGHLAQRAEPLARVAVQRVSEEFHEAVTDHRVEEVLRELHLFIGRQERGATCRHPRTAARR